jgi:hypothetical protein
MDFGGQGRSDETLLKSKTTRILRDLSGGNREALNQLMPTVRVTGRLKPGLHNLTLRFPPDEPPCFNGTGARLILRYVVSVTPR